MTDTPNRIKKLQLRICLSKTPEERLLQAVCDNENLFNFWKQAKVELAERERAKN